MLTLSQTNPVFTCLKYKPFENTEGKGEITGNKQFLLFPQCFLPVRRIFCYFHRIWNCRLQTLSVWKSLKFVVWERVNRSIFRVNRWILLFTKQQNFRLVQIQRICRQRNRFRLKIENYLLEGRKLLWKKVKMLVTSIFSFSHNASKNPSYGGGGGFVGIVW